MMVIDGRTGEGGGQITRTAIGLSMLTGIPVEIEHIRGKRSRPGLMRQHLTALEAAAAICGAETQGLELGSEHVRFTPGEVRPDTYRFAVGTAGSATLVLQTVLPALMVLPETSTLILEGGTHNPMAPTYHFLESVFAPRLGEFGVRLALELEQHGFYPAGGGRFEATITGRLQDELERVDIEERGEQIGAAVVATVANLPDHIARREVDEVSHAMAWPTEHGEVRTVTGPGPGNVVWAELEFERLTEMFTAFGAKGRRAEQVGQDLAAQIREYLKSRGPVGEHLADQLLLPMALVGEGAIVCTPPSIHTRTQAEIIEKFLPVEFTFTNMQETAPRTWKITVTS